MKKFVLGGSVFIVIAGCATVAVTGRSQLSLLTDEQVVKMANQTSTQLMSSYGSKGLILNPGESVAAKETVDQVNRVAIKILDASGLRTKTNWQITVIKSDVPNASVLPNGRMFIHTGLLPVTQTEAGLAAVIGHEVAHVAARHGAERVSQVVLADAAMKGISAAVAASRNSQYRPAIDAAMGVGVKYGVLMPYSRTHESEADRIGQIYMAKAGYDPAEAIAVWDRMAKLKGDSKIDFFATHPASLTRKQELTDWLPQARLYYDDRNRPLPKSLDEIEVAQKERDKAASAFPIGLKPDIREDYWYKFRTGDLGNGLLIRFDRLHDCPYGKCVTVMDEKNEKKTVTDDFRIIKVERADGSSVAFDPPLRNIRFPVAVGDEWEDSITVRSSTGKTSAVALRTRVLGYEAVEVPAGSFMAYRTASSMSGNTVFEGWYVPEARGFVKSVVRDAQGQTKTSVMVDYQRSDDPAGALGEAQRR